MLPDDELSEVLVSSLETLRLFTGGVLKTSSDKLDAPLDMIADTGLVDAITLFANGASIIGLAADAGTFFLFELSSSSSESESESSLLLLLLLDPLLDD